MSDKIKTLSQAIRLGATFRPKCKGQLFKDGGSCALGAAYEAITGNYLESKANSATFSIEQASMIEELERRFPELPWTEIFLRSDRGETREAIADWLEAQGL